MVSSTEKRLNMTIVTRCARLAAATRCDDEVKVVRSGRGGGVKK